MTDIRFKPFKQQQELLKSKHRFKGAFAGKRCLDAKAKIQTADGEKAIADISGNDLVLAFDPKANQFLLTRATASFPKAKMNRYRVIHEQGEFVASGHHRIFCSDHKYRSVLEIIQLLSRGATAKEVSFLSPQSSNSAPSRLMYTPNVPHCFQKHEDYLSHCESCNYPNGPQPRPFSKSDRSLFRPSPDARLLSQLNDHKFFFSQDDFLDTKSTHTRPDQSFDLQKNERDFCQKAFPFLGSVDLNAAEFFEPNLHADQQAHQFDSNLTFQNEALSFVSDFQLSVFSCNSQILEIEVERDDWVWDFHVPIFNNYVCEGAIHHNSGKTEYGAIQKIIWQDSKPHELKTWNNIDPYLGIIAAPTHEMLRDLSWKKFLAYAKPFIKRQWQSPLTIEWHDGSEIRGVSADRPERLEGKKVHSAWIDEVFQTTEQFFLEMQARVSDSKGYILCTGSLGIQYVNPKSHWAYKYFKSVPEDPDFFSKEWATADNPYFPKDELERFKRKLDSRTFNAMFRIEWDTIAKNAVYGDWSEENEADIPYDPELPVTIAIDWGWATQMACLFIQHDPHLDRINVIDEIVGPNIKLEHLWLQIKDKNYPVSNWCCDIAGNQEREQTGISNIEWFNKLWESETERKWVRDNWGFDSRNFVFHTRASGVQYGIALTRTFVRTATGRIRFNVNPKKCPATIDSIKNYRYPERGGIILNENPIKENDHCCDAARYYVVCNHDQDLDRMVTVGRYA